MKSGVTLISEGDDSNVEYTDPYDLTDPYTTKVLKRATLTILSGGGGSLSVVTFNETIDDSTILDGFTVEDIQPGEPGYPLIAITGGGSNSEVINCIIRNNQGAGQSGGVGTRGRWSPSEYYNTAPIIDSNFIHYVNGPGVGNGPYSHATVTNNEIWDCNGNEGAGSPGIGLQGDAYPTITGNTVFECRSGIGSLGPAGDGNLEAMDGTLTIPTIKGNTIHDNTEGGIRLARETTDTGTVNITIGENGNANTIYDNGAGGIRIDGVTDTTTNPTNVTVQYNNIYSNTGGSGTDLNYLTDATVTGNTIYNNYWGGISVWETVDTVTIEGNTIYGNGSGGIGVQYETLPPTPPASQTVVIQNNNDIYNNGMGGIFIETATAVTIDGNTIHENGRSGIRLDSGSGTVSGNDIYQNGTAVDGGGGIGFQDGCNTCTYTITENEIHDNIFGGIHTGSNKTDGTGYAGMVGGLELTITKNKVYGNGQSNYGGGIDVRHVAGTLYNNLVYENNMGGIRFGDYITEIINNTVADNGVPLSEMGGGIIFDDLAGAVNDTPGGTMSTGKLIRNNVIYQSEMAGLRVGGWADPVWVACPDNPTAADTYKERDYNDLHGNHPWNDAQGRWNDADCKWPNLDRSCTMQQYGACGMTSGPPPWYLINPNDTLEDPLFVAPGSDDYRLGGSSPLIDRGCPLATYNDTDTSRNDMGAYGGPDPLPYP
jgi:parallel beta-helix repeat protein